MYIAKLLCENSFRFPPLSIDCNQSNSYGIFMLAMWHVLYKIYVYMYMLYAMCRSYVDCPTNQNKAMQLCNSYCRPMSKICLRLYFVRFSSVSMRNGLNADNGESESPFTERMDCAGWLREYPDCRQWSGRCRTVLRSGSSRSVASWTEPLVSDCWEHRGEPNARSLRPPKRDTFFVIDILLHYIIPLKSLVDLVSFLCKTIIEWMNR